jgi:outer membrane protein assembly factor BamB
MRRSALVVCFAVAAVLTVSIPLSAQNWPSFRGTQAAGVGSGAPPVEWDVAKGRNVVWKTPVPGLGHSSPVVWGDAVYVTTAVPARGDSKLQMANDKVVMADDQIEHTWRLLAIDRRTGKILWNQVAHQGVPSAQRHVKSSFANATPATDGRYILALMGSEALVAFDPSGKLVWKKAIEPAADRVMLDQSSSPILYGQSVILQNDRRRGSYIAAFELATGKELWRVERNEGMSWSTPTVVRASAGGKPRDVLVTQSGRFIRGLDPATGKEIWQMAQNDPEPWDRIPAPVAGGDLVFVAGGNPSRPVFAIRKAATGDISLQKDQTSNAHVAWSTSRGGAYMPTPIVVGKVLYVLRENGVLSAYRASNGESLYQQRLGNGGYFSASPVAARGQLYMVNDDGEAFVVRAGEKFELLKQNAMGEMCFATPALSGDMLIVRTRSHVYGIAESKKAEARR